MFEFFSNAAENIMNFLSGIILQIIVAIIILLIGFILGRVAEKLVNRMLHEVDMDKMLKAAGSKFSLENFLSKSLKYLIYFIFIIFALNQLGITATILYIVLVAILIVLIISTFFGIKDFIPNFFAGISIYRKKYILVGEKIRVNDVEGEVIQVNLTETRLRTKKGDIIYFPNSTLMKSKIVKLKKRNKSQRKSK